MSATNRGSERKPSDFYPTPLNTIRTFLDNYELNKNGIILEPCAGNGNFIKVIREYGYTNKIVANEILEEHIPRLKELGIDIIHNKDFLQEDVEGFCKEDVTTIITNPPFSLAREFLEKCFKEYPNAEVIMLLRTAFLESKSRRDFWNKYTLNGLYTLTERPRFINNKSDATSYSFFVFTPNSNKQTIKVI